MQIKSKSIPAPALTALIGLGLIALTTILLLEIQAYLSTVEGHPVRPFEMGYLVPVAILTLVSGFAEGIVSLVICLLCSAYFLMPGPGFRVDNASDLAGLGFLAVNSLFMIAAVDTAKRNHFLRLQAQNRAGRERLLGQVARAARRSLEPSAIQKHVLTLIALSLQADRAYILVHDELHGITSVSAEWHLANLPPLAAEPFPLEFHECLSEARSDHAAEADDPHNPSVGPFHGNVSCPGLSSVMHVPLSSGERIDAILGVAMAGQQRGWSADEVALVEVVSAEMTAVVDSARLALRERRIAETLQKALLPQPHVDIEGIEVATFYKAAMTEAGIGGDFCDVFQIFESTWAIAVGDVSGKGLAAASQIATVRNMLRTELYQGKPISTACEELNQLLSAHGLLQGFVTLFVALYDTSNRTISYVNCGHEPALMQRADGRIFQMAPTGTVLGVIEDAKFETRTLELKSSDRFLIYTDGITEAKGSRRAEFGIEGLISLLAETPRAANASGLARQVMARVLAFADGKLHDDVCLLIAVAADRPDGSSVPG